MRSLNPFVKIVIPTFLIVAIASFFFVFSSQAASLTAVYVYLSRVKAGLNGTAGNTLEVVLAITPASSIPTGGTVTIEFADDADTQWCRTAGSLTVAGVTSSSADLAATNWDIDSALPTTGTLSAACTQGSGASSVDKITITAVDALTAGTTYGVQLSNNTGLLGTASSAGSQEITVTVSQGTTIDSKTFRLYLVSDDQVVVSATVSAAPTVNCTISANTVNLGTLYPGGAYAVGSHTISTDTTASGYYWAAYGTGDGSTDAGLYKSTATTKLLPSGSTATLNLSTPGVEGFGMILSDPDAAGAAVVSTDFTGPAPTFGTLDRTFAGAKLLLQQNGDQSSAESSTVTYGARAGAAAPAGSYQETVTFICGGYY